MKNVLVTGAAGFIGTQIVLELIKREYKVHALIEKNDTNSKEKLLSIDEQIQIIEDFDEMFSNASECPMYDKIYHLATVGVRPDFNDISLICDVNIKMSCKLVDFAKRNNSGLLVNFGSCFEYGDHGNILLTEDMECRPESLYAISKNASTKLTTAYAKSQGISMITVRPFGVFGEGEALTRLAPSIINSCLNGQVVNTTEGQQVRDFVNVKDLAKAIVMLAEADYESYEIYNICSDNPVKVKDFILEMVEICGLDASLINFGSIPYRANEAMIFAGDNKKLQSVINYPFPNNHKEGILDIYNAIKEG